MPFAGVRWLVAVLLFVPMPLAAQTPRVNERPVRADVEASLPSATGHIRQLVFDGDPKSYFASAGPAKRSDHLTLRFDTPVAVRSILVTTGTPDGADALEHGMLEISVDGQEFTKLTAFAAGTVHAKLKDRQVQAIRIKPTADLKHPLVIREIAVESDPPVASFKHPVEVVVDVADAPELKDWAENCARLCERNYDMICAELASPGFKPRSTIRMTLTKDYQGVAAASGGRITGSVSYFKSHPNDQGAMIHETVHCVQAYRTRGNPGWLVEGIADYVRFFKYEPGKLGKINAERAHYNGSYRVTAAFLAYVSDKYDKHLVRKLNQAMREGEYREEIWKVLTKKSLQDLDTEWRATLRPRPTSLSEGRQPPDSALGAPRTEFFATESAKNVGNRKLRTGNWEPESETPRLALPYSRFLVPGSRFLVEPRRRGQA